LVLLVWWCTFEQYNISECMSVRWATIDIKVLTNSHISFSVILVYTLCRHFVVKMLTRIVMVCVKNLKTWTSSSLQNSLIITSTVIWLLRYINRLSTSACACVFVCVCVRVYVCVCAHIIVRACMCACACE